MGWCTLGWPKKGYREFSVVMLYSTIQIEDLGYTGVWINKLIEWYTQERYIPQFPSVHRTNLCKDFHHKMLRERIDERERERERVAVNPRVGSTVRAEKGDSTLNGLRAWMRKDWGTHVRLAVTKYLTDISVEAGWLHFLLFKYSLLKWVRQNVFILIFFLI